MEQPLVLHASLDRESYRIGDPAVVTLWLKNEGDSRVMLARGLDHRELTFTGGAEGLGVPVRHEPVHSSGLSTTTVTLEPGKMVLRRFLFTDLTKSAGASALLAQFKGAIAEDGAVLSATFSPPVIYTVEETVGLRRDRASGLILKEQALELARADAQGEVAASRAVLLPLGDTGLYLWAVLMRTRSAEGKTDEYAVQVNPYSGSVSPLDLALAEQLEGAGTAAAKPAD